MIHILIAGGGRVGLLAGAFLASSGDYQVHIADVKPVDHTLDLGRHTSHLCHCVLDITQHKEVQAYIKQHQISAIASALPYFLTKEVAKLAVDCQLAYFDLTEDVASTQYVKKQATQATRPMAPQCGLAPGFISIVTADLYRQFDQVDSIKMRVGALPINSNNPLQYGLTWSTAGVINEYLKPCEAIVNYQPVMLEPLANCENLQIDGLSYEAFNTSGGIGSLSQTYQGKVKSLNYKTIRYPGHCEKLKFLIHGLKLKDKEGLLREIFEHALPQVKQDVVLVYVSCEGTLDNTFCERNFVKKYYAQEAFGQLWSALQLTTACGLTVTIDMTLKEKRFAAGFVKQEDIPLEDLMNHRFGRYYRDGILGGMPHVTGSTSFPHTPKQTKQSS